MPPLRPSPSSPPPPSPSPPPPSPSQPPPPPPQSPSPPLSPRAYTYTFTTKASLKTAVQAYNANPTAAIATYGPIADWDVSAITDMSELFYNLRNFNADISNWDTSVVTNMDSMFWVRSARALAHSLESGPPRACRLRRRHPTPSRPPGRTSSRIPCPPFDSAGYVGVQPAAQLRHVQGHDHGLHVLRALRACPDLQH
eukprot:scaffold32656_cov108-Phaeocystis_antarctica.AAC.3